MTKRPWKTTLVVYTTPKLSGSITSWRASERARIAAANRLPSRRECHARTKARFSKSTKESSVGNIMPFTLRSAIIPWALREMYFSTRVLEMVDSSLSRPDSFHGSGLRNFEIVLSFSTLGVAQSACWMRSLRGYAPAALALSPWSSLCTMWSHVCWAASASSSQPTSASSEVIHSVLVSMCLMIFSHNRA